jgi:transposase
MKMSAGVFVKRARSFAGVSPVRIATGRSDALGRASDPGDRRAEVAFDVDGERFER